MKKTNITIQYDDEKLRAIRIYSEKKGSSVEDELADCLHKMYEKHVPKDAREYIELVSGDVAAKPRARGTAAKKAAAPLAAPPSQPVSPTQEVSSGG